MNKEIDKAVRAGIPIFIGYFPAAVAFGILAKGCNLTLVECVMFSAIVFAGASQFIALNLMMTGMGPGGIVLTTLLVNFRHFLMSASLSKRLEKVEKHYLAAMAFGITDETFSVLSFTRGDLSKTFVFALELSAYSGWVSGTVCGYLAGGFLPDILTESMGVALYALLLAILLPEVKQSTRAWVLASASALLNYSLVKADLLPSGWSIVICIVLISMAGAFWPGSDKKAVGHE